MQTIKRIPYGKGDFEAVNAENRYYLDKTMYIPRLEQTDYIFFIRPRRFGKTLLLSTLQSYYDILKKDRFQEDKRSGYCLEYDESQEIYYEGSGKKNCITWIPGFFGK